MKKNIKKGWKSTITGVVILIAALVYMLLVQPVDYYIFCTALIVGVLLLFSPDTLINKIELFLGFNNNNKTE